MEVKSTHKAEVVPVTLTPHNNADTLSVVRAFGYDVCVRTADWAGLTLGVYIPPDSVVDVRRPEFAFLADQAKADGQARIKARKLRGVVSFGLLIPAPAGAQVGEDLAEALGVQHYEPPLEHEKGEAKLCLGGDATEGPALDAVKYDLDSFRRYGEALFTPGESVVVTEKLDGCNARFVYWDGQMHCGSKTEWKREYPDYSHITLESLREKGIGEDQAHNILAKLASRSRTRSLWWETLEQTPNLENFCRDNPGTIVYGEIAGRINCIRYRSTNRFAAFDLWQEGHWLDYSAARNLAPDLPWVPTLAENVRYDFDTVCALAEGNTTWQAAEQPVIREGCVVKPLVERKDPRLGRICLKVVSGTYLEKYR